jgi:ketosteroid isomerase-like protein
MPRTLVFVAVVLVTAASFYARQTAFAQAAEKPLQQKTSGRDAKITAAVRAVLDAQVAAWNRGDIEGFMDGYARSGETVFVSGDTVTHGWQTVLDRYKKGYDSREKMGQLTFSDLEITPISKDAAVALGRWQLVRAKDTPHGRFTLIFRRTKAGWRIVHDHTSSAE